MTRNSFRASSSVLKKYLLSFILVFIIPSIFVILFFNSYTSNIINKQAERELQSRFDDSYKSVEQRLGDTINILIQACVDGDTLSLANAEELNIDTLMRMKDYSGKILQYGMFNSFISNFIVYYRNNDVIITDRGKYGFYFYFNEFFNLNNIDSKQFMDILQSSHYRYVVPIKTISSNNIPVKNVITMVQSFPIGNENSTGSIVISLDEDAIIKMMNLGNENGKDCFMMIDNNGKILTQRGSVSIQGEILSNIIKSDSNLMRKQKIDDKYMTVFFKKSSLNDWWYIYFVPEEEMESSISSFKKLLLEVIALFIISGFCMAVFFSLFNYSPIKAIIREISAKGNGRLKNSINTSDELNEYNLIKNYINELYTEKNTLDSRVNIFVNDVKSNFLRELIIGSFNEEKFISTSKLLNMTFANPAFCFICVEFYTKVDLDSEELNRYFLIMNEFDEFCNNVGNKYKLTLGRNRIGIIANLESNSTIDAIYKDYNIFIQSIKSKYGASIKIGIGNIYDGFESIPLTYKESLEALKFAMFYDLSMSTYRSINNENNEYFCSLNTENKLVNSLESGQYTDTEVVIQDIFNTNLSHTKLSINAVFALYSNLIRIINKMVEKNHIKQVNAGTEFVEVLDIEDMQNVEYVINNILCHCKRICAIVRNIKEQSLNKLVNDIISYLKENYNDANLSCSFVADKFSISQTYLSNTVKKNIGMSYGDYINFLRIEKAKVLLKQSGSSVNEIAAMLGYNSSNSFIRTFKSIEGITPGQYTNTKDGMETTM